GPLGRALRAIETQGRAVLVTGARTRPAPRVALPPALAAALDSIPDWSVPAPGDVRDAVGGRN
ncbi:hypothetical protein ACOID6_28140, partial [Klebsiella pneumoniae]|uniref:hypothetical protein n=1 Tax=Klebsiella pneumoniae TaxID=573 RepID=UPI003B596D61